jgi:hypothetical protein
MVEIKLVIEAKLSLFGGVHVGAYALCASGFASKKSFRIHQVLIVLCY